MQCSANDIHRKLCQPASRFIMNLHTLLSYTLMPQHPRNLYLKQDLIAMCSHFRIVSICLRNFFVSSVSKPAYCNETCDMYSWMQPSQLLSGPRSQQYSDSHGPPPPSVIIGWTVLIGSCCSQCSIKLIILA